MQFKSIKEYYDADYENRERSPEIDYGVWWRLAGSRETYRVTFVEKARELIAVNQYTGGITIIAYFDSRAQVERALKGWGEHCGGPESLNWLIRAAISDALGDLT